MRVVVGFVMVSVSVTGVLHQVPVILGPTSNPDYVPTDHDKQIISTRVRVGVRK